MSLLFTTGEGSQVDKRRKRGLKSLRDSMEGREGSQLAINT